MKRFSVLICLACLVAMAALFVPAPAIQAQAQPASVTSLSYPAQTGDWDCTPTAFCCLLQKFHWQRTGVDPGPLSSQFMGDLSFDLGYASAPDHGFGNGVGMEISRSFGSCEAALCRPGQFTVSDEMKRNALQYRSAQRFLWKSGCPTYAAAVELMKREPLSGIVLGPNSHHSYAVIGVDANDRLIGLDPFGRGGRPRMFTMLPGIWSAKWRRYAEDDLVVIFGE